MRRTSPQGLYNMTATITQDCQRAAITPKNVRLLVGLWYLVPRAGFSSRLVVPGSPRRFCTTKLFLPHKKKPAERRRARKTSKQTQHGRRHNEAKNSEYARRREATSAKKPAADTRPERTARHSTDGNGKARDPQSTQPTGNPARRHQPQATRRRDKTEGGNNSSSTRPEDNARAEPGTNEDAPPEHHGRNGQDDEHGKPAGSPGARSHTATTHDQQGRKTPENTAHTAEHLRRKKQKTTSPGKQPPHGAPQTPRRRIGHDAARDWRGFSFDFLRLQ